MTSTSPQLDLLAALNKFGLAGFRRGQQEVIEHVIAGHDCLCVMPTGGGKSLCYQLPSVVRPGLTIVVSPLIALMKDQVDSLIKRGIRATLINSSLSTQEQNDRLDQVAAGRFALVYVAPERLRNPRFLDSIRATPVQLLAIDEAHCISEWGHDFRPDYQRLGRFREALGNVQTIALTATATPRVRADILKSLQLNSAPTFITGFARENLYFGSVQCMSDRDKDRNLLQFLAGRDESGIIYVATRKRCEALVDQLAKELRLSVGAYHAGLLPEQRKLIQDKFMAGELKAIVATNAFGMGIDKSDLRYVVHYNMPGTLEAYYQEAGRAGRDGLLSQCVLLYSPQDRYIQEFFIENANPPRSLLQSVYEFLLECEEDPIELTADEIRENIGQTATAEAVNSSLQILSRTGVMERLEMAGGLAMFRLSNRLPSLVDLLPRDANVRRNVLRAVEKAVGDRRDEPVYVHPRLLLQQLQMDRDTLSRHLRELCKLEDFEYVPPFRGRAIHFRRRDVAFDDLSIDHEALAVRKKADYEKLDQMVAYARSNACRQRTFLEYFGDTSAANCGICDRCQGRSGWPTLPAPTATAPANVTAKATATSTATATAIGSSATDILVIAGTASHAESSEVVAKSSPSITPSKPATKRNAATELAPVDPQVQRDAIELLQSVLGAIERTHGYLSKTVLTQHFSGVASKAVTGLRLQRLPEFGLLKDWKKAHASGLIYRMLDHGLIQQSEVRMGKLTVSITELGLRCRNSAIDIPPSILEHMATALRATRPEPQAASRGSSTPSVPATSPHQPAAAGTIPTRPTPRQDPPASPVQTTAPSEQTTAPPEQTTASPEQTPVSPVRTPASPIEAIDLIRTAEQLPPVTIQDADRTQVVQPMLIDWQWTLRLVRHGYRLGECALIRGKTPDAILADLTQALENNESVPIDRLLDRRTAIAIKEMQESTEQMEHAPAALQAFSSLWPFVKRWLRQGK